MKSKLFTYKVIIPICLVLAALTALSFVANSAIIVPRIKDMEHRKEYSPKLSENGQFLVDFAQDENGKKYGLIGIFEGGRYCLKNAYVPSKFEDVPITVIENGAFSGFDTLEKVVIPSSIKKIEKNVFNNSPNLKAVYIPSEVEDISKDSFDSNNKFTLYVEKGSYAEKFAVEHKIKYEHYTAEENAQDKVDFSKTASGLYFNDFQYDILYSDAEPPEPFGAIASYNYMAEEESLSIPSYINDIKITTIAEGAIKSHTVREVILPETVTTVCESAFSDCYSLDKVYFTKNVSYIEKSAFGYLDDVVICAPKDSYAHKYAEKNNIKFEETDN